MKFFRSKKASLIMSAVLAVVWMPLVPATSQAVTVGDFDYSIAGKTATVLGCSSTCPSSLVIPATVPGKPTVSVTSIGNKAFYDFQSGLQFSTVSFPASLISIQESAFANTTISGPLVLPAKLVRIENAAFAEASLSSITFNKALNYIGELAFSDAQIAAESTLEMQSGEIARQAFEGISFIKVTLGPEFSTLGSRAFAKPYGMITAPKINDLSIAGGDIGVSAFAETEIDKISLGSKIGLIAENAFSGPNNEAPVVRGALTVNSGIISEGSFQNSSFTSVTIGKSVSTISTRAFGYFSAPYPSLGRVTIDARIIGPYSMSNATMSSLNIGTNVASIGMGAFGGIDGPYSLGDIDIKGGIFSESSFKSIDATKTTITSTVKKIGESAFFDSDLGALSINALQIGGGAFNQSEATSLTLGANVKSIGPSAFSGFQITGSNKAISIDPEIIGSRAFNQSNITGLTLGSKVRLIGDSAFADAPFLQNVVVNSGQIGRESFNGSGIETLVIGSGVTSIGEGAFLETRLDSLDIASGLSVIEKSAFSRLGGTLTNVRIPNSVVTIGESAFNGAGISSISLGAGLKYLEEGAFGQNADLADISFYGPPPAGDDAFPFQAMNLNHTASNLAAWTAKFAANPNWSVPPITRVTGLAQPTLTFTSVSNEKPTASKVIVKANYSMSTTGKVQVTVTKSGSKAVLCTKTVTTRNLSGSTGIATCDLSKKVRDELKKKAQTLTVSLTYTPDLGDSKTLTKSLTMRKQ